MALAATAGASMIVLGPGIAAAGPAVTPGPDLIQPVVRLGQTDPLAAFLECAPTGLIPVFGPSIVFPICLA
ncbi:hypothetical protein [Rhodococcus sp. NPDC058514]|uniref:hypothetical protein n=1 Tax=unclassified Rhodococcus (in: high G+C Gram-positive bacteria) TaxID=192944 RepID=UPI003666CEF5